MLNVPPRDVIWISLESIRQDHTSLGSHDRNTTPFLKSISRSGTSSKHCYSHDIWTRASSASILTGYPSSAHQAWSLESSLPEEIETIPEKFTEAGYQTSCITPIAQISHATGLDRGFEHFHTLNKSNILNEAGFLSLAKWALNIRRHSGGFTMDGGRHCTGYLINDIAKRYIKAVEEDEPLFLYLHHGDTHHAYVPPVAWREKFESDLPLPVDEAIDLAVDMSKNLHRYIASEEPFSEDEWTALEVLYDTSIAYVDYLVNRLVTFAKDHLDDPIIVITSDHGEFFGHRGLLAHMLDTTAEVSNIPLVVLGLDTLPNNSLIQPADVMKIICKELNIAHDVPAGIDVRTDEREFAITQRSGARADKKLHRVVRK